MSPRPAFRRPAPRMLTVRSKPAPLAADRSRNLRPVGPVARELLRQSWRLRLKLAAFDDIEDERGNLREHYPHQSRGFRHTPWSRAEYYRLLGVVAWKFSPKKDGRTPFRQKDRKIAHALAEGCRVREIKAQQHVTYRRIQRVLKALHVLMKKENDDGEG